MSLWNKPRERIGKTGESVPEDFLRVDELTEFALPAFWGTDFVEKAIGVLPYGLDATPMIRNAIDRGRYVLLATRLKKSLVRGELAAWELRTTPAGELSHARHISTSAWDEVEINTLLYPLAHGTWEHQGQAHQTEPNVSLTAFKVDEVERWLANIRPLTLPLPPEQSGREDLRADHITASQAIGWLAGQPVDDWYRFQEFGGEIRDLHGEITGLQASGNLGTTFDRACMSLASKLAEKLCRQSAALTILQLMAEGRLKGYGVPEKGGVEMVEIPREQFLVQSEFIAMEDRLVPALGNDRESHELSLTGGRWKHVRFLKSDFFTAYRSPSADISPLESASTESRIAANELPARRPKHKAATAAIKKMVQLHGDGGAPQTAIEAEQWLRKEFGLSRDAARRMWSELTPATWRLRGRPKNIREK